MLILVFFIGFFLLARFTRKDTMLERLGFSLPIGLAVVTMLMVVIDWMNIGLTRTSLTIITIAALIGSLAININNCKNISIEVFMPKPRHCWFNLLWLLMFGVVVYLEYINFEKCMVYPVYDRDSLAAFDTIGYVCAQEHTFHAMSIFDPTYFPHMHEAGSSISYLPMIQLSYAYVYTFGAATSKAIPAFIYLGFLIGFYGLCARKLTHTGAMLAVLGIVTAPEMLSFASLSVTNVMQACMASTGIIYACLGVKNHDRSDLCMSIVLLAINNWMRAEGVVFVLVAWMLIAISSFVSGNRKMAIWPAIALCPLVLWMVYSNACGLTSESAIITHPYWDGVKATTVFNGAWSLLSAGIYYGWTFHIFVFALALHIAYIVIKVKVSSSKVNFETPAKHEGLMDFLVPIAMVLCIVGYYVILYQVDYKWDSIDNVLAYSAKRFNFCFVPIAWYYVASATPVNKFFDWMERGIGLGRQYPSKDKSRTEIFVFKLFDKQTYKGNTKKD